MVHDHDCPPSPGLVRPAPLPVHHPDAVRDRRAPWSRRGRDPEDGGRTRRVLGGRGVAAALPPPALERDRQRAGARGDHGTIVAPLRGDRRGSPIQPAMRPTPMVTDREVTMYSPADRVDSPASEWGHGPTVPRLSAASPSGRSRRAGPVGSSVGCCRVGRPNRSDLPPRMLDRELSSGTRPRRRSVSCGLAETSVDHSAARRWRLASLRFASIRTRSGWC